MKVKTVLIAWHGREPVYSIDFHSSGRIATGGADNCVNVRSRKTITLAVTQMNDGKMALLQIWKVAAAMDGDVQVEFQANLTRHQKAVNAVRFSPNGPLNPFRLLSFALCPPRSHESVALMSRRVPGNRKRR
jgi:chromatin assembly factor 1 subunit B